MWLQLLQTQPKLGSGESHDGEKQDLAAFPDDMDAEDLHFILKDNKLSFFLPSQIFPLSVCPILCATHTGNFNNEQPLFSSSYRYPKYS